jgi:hypothetical protein
MAAAVDVPPGRPGSTVAVVAEYRRKKGTVTLLTEVAAAHAVLVASLATRAREGGVASGDGEHAVGEKEGLVAGGEFLGGVVDGR